MRNSNGAHLSRDRGAGLVEAAICIPLLVFLAAIIFSSVSSLRERTMLLELTKLTARAAASQLEANALFDVQLEFNRIAERQGVDVSRYAATGVKEEVAAGTGRKISFYKVEVSRIGGVAAVFGAAFGVTPKSSVFFAIENQS